MSHKRCVYGLFLDRDEALAAYVELQARGCRPERCSILIHEGMLGEAANAPPVAGLTASADVILGAGPLAAACRAVSSDQLVRRIEDELWAGKIIVGVVTDDAIVSAACSDVFAAHGARLVA